MKKPSKILYFGKKALAFLLSVLVLSLAVFYVSRLAPGDPLVSYYGDRAEKLTPQERAQAEEKLGLDEPIFTQYVRWAQNESEGDYIGFGLTERYDCVDWANWAAERFPGLPVYLMGVSLGGATVLMAAGDILPAAVHGVIADSAYTSPRAIWQHVMGKNLHLPVRAATVIADLLCQKRLNASSGSYSTVEALKNTDVPILLIHGEDDHFVPLKMAFENRDACAAPCKLLVVPGADHAMSYYMGRGAYEAAVRAFWERFDK